MLHFNSCMKCGEQTGNGNYCVNCAPAQEEKEMREKVIIDCAECGEEYEIDSLHDCRTADLRQLHRDAALAALCGCATYDTCVEKMVASSIRYADEFIRQYNPDAVIAEVVG